MSQAIADPATHRRSGHSASTSLSGKALLAAWMASILVHLTALAVMFLLVFPFTSLADRAERPSPRVQLLGPLDADGEFPADSLELSNAARDAAPLQIEFTPDPPERAVRPPAADPPEFAIVGIGGAGDFENVGLGLGGDAAPDFFGVGQSARGARSVVYVVDRSGSMIDTFQFVRDELKRSVSSLRRSQKFHVIFFNAREPLENLPKRPVNAVEAHIQPFFAFLDQVVPTGGTKPELALKRAIEMKPDLVYLLSDGVDFEPDLLSKLDDWNRDRSVRICTIAYLDQTGRAVLETIARAHGGEFKFVSEYDLP